MVIGFAAGTGISTLRLGRRRGFSLHAFISNPFRVRGFTGQAQHFAETAPDHWIRMFG